MWSLLWFSRQSPSNAMRASKFGKLSFLLKRWKRIKAGDINTNVLKIHILVILTGAHCCQIIWNQWSGRSPLVGWPSSPGERKLIKITSALSPLLGTFSFPRLLLSKNKIVGLGTEITPFTIAKFSHHVLRKYYGKPKYKKTFYIKDVS